MKYFFGRAYCYSAEYQKKRKELLIKTDSKCVVCREETNSIHHLDGDNQNNLVDNLLPLCAKCHSLVHVCYRKYSVEVVVEILKILFGRKNGYTSDRTPKN